jgi:hypothetical protein
LLAQRSAAQLQFFQRAGVGGIEGGLQGGQPARQLLHAAAVDPHRAERLGQHRFCPGGGPIDARGQRDGMAKKGLGIEVQLNQVGVPLARLVGKRGGGLLVDERLIS